MKCPAVQDPRVYCEGEDRTREYDAQGIFLTYACDDCRAGKLARYRPEILRGYTQADVDEPIEEDC